jgi:hypothetical protein
LKQFGEALVQYGAALEGASNSDSALKTRLGALDQDARSIAATAPAHGFSHTLALLQEIAKEQDWAGLQEQAARHIGAGDDELSQGATRFLALALSHSSGPHDKEKAISLYETVIAGKSAEPGDSAVLAALLSEAGRQDEAKKAVLAAIAKFPDQSAAFSEIGQKLVEATGDRDFREKLDKAVKARAK